MGEHESNSNTSTTENSLKLPPAVLSPQNKSSSSNNASNIKERLNLHVKRRLQETTESPQDSRSSSSTKVATINSNSGSTVATTSATSSGNINIHHQNQHKSGHERLSSSTHHGRGGATKRMKRQMSTPTTSLNSSSIIDDDCSSRDSGNPNNQLDNHPSKDKDTGPDLLTMVLNEKKHSLMKSPEIISFLESIIGTLRK